MVKAIKIVAADWCLRDMTEEVQRNNYIDIAVPEKTKLATKYGSRLKQ